MINYKKPIIVIAGSTASGKSSLAIKLAKEIDGYIINADSRQIYKELKIGTAQPTPQRIENKIWYIDGIKHYLYGNISVTEKYSIYKYQKDVQKILNKEDLIPILVGGTGLYIDSIIYNYNLKSESVEETEYSRDKLNKMNVKELQELIPEKTLKNMNQSDSKNPRRLIRVIERGGEIFSKGKSLNFTYFVIDLPMKTLEKRIKERVEIMIKNGLEEENRKLINKGFSYNLPALQSIGYQEFDGFFDGRKNLEDVKRDIVTHTLQYARRQKVWFKKNEEVIYITNPSLSSLKAQLTF